MPRTLEQVLKAKGYTDQELVDLAPMLTNAKFRSSLEAELSAADALADQNNKLSTDLNAYDKWFMEEITPEHEKLMKERADAIAEAAAAKAKLEAYQKLGMRKQAGAAAAEPEPKPETKEPNLPGFDPNKYVSTDTFNQAADSFGDAIANGVDLVLDHQELFGSRINMTQLRLEAKAAKQPVRAYWEHKFKVADKRAEIAAKRTADHEASIREDERKKLMIEFGSNPNVRTPVISGNPFVIKRKQPEGAKQPWEINESERSSKRVENAFKKAVDRGEVAVH